MKRSSLSYDGWKCIKSKEMYGKMVNTDFLKGYVGLIAIKEVSEIQIWRFHGEDITVCDKGIKWLSILPENDFYCITAMMNEKNEILLWYIDMIAEQGTDEKGIPFFDDLYLDLVVYPNGLIIEDDMDELNEALSLGDISQDQFHLAIRTSDYLKARLKNNIESFIEFTLKCFELIS